MSREKILIIDYEMCNIGSITNALEYLKGDYFVSSKKNDIDKADAIILPGVGAFGAAMGNLKKLDLLDKLNKNVLVKKKPFLGICLGMQLLAEDSVEQGFFKGFKWINGHVLRIEPRNNFRVPHVGWNNLKYIGENQIFKGINNEANFYFDHSYHLKCDKELIIATCDYGDHFVAAIRKENIFATQFHPEKSQRNGLKLLRNFLNFVKINSYRIEVKNVKN